MNYYIKCHEWEENFTKLRMIKKIHSKNELVLRQFMEGVWYIGRSGCQWRLLPEYYGNWRGKLSISQKPCSSHINAVRILHITMCAQNSCNTASKFIPEKFSSSAPIFNLL
ncbi:MAG: transposase [Rickettsiales bacterium]|nr:MAG: transposase [Rickettsiales bacterium]